jgi:phage terminase large subunit-like protein
LTTPASASLASSLASLPDKGQELLGSLSDDEVNGLLYDWKFWARPAQLEPEGAWRIWLILAGRGFGKTRTGAEWIRSKVENSMQPLRIALVAKTPSDARDVMIEGESGLLEISPNWSRPQYQPSKRRLTWPNGTIGTVYSSKEYDTLRGPQHHIAWCDELASWHYPQETWDNLMLGLRLGSNPQIVVTTTPKPIPIVKDLVSRASGDVRMTGGSTYENSENLPAAFFSEIVSRYEGTTLGQQELWAKLISDNPAALWKRETLDKHRVLKAPVMRQVVVAIDPAASSGESAAETGIMGCGLGVDGHGYLLEDASQSHATPDRWGRAAVTLFNKLKANMVVAEANNGGEMVAHVIHTIDRDVPVELVHASRSKQTRAEPVAALDEQGKIHHVGMFGTLEDQLCQWVPGEESPDRLDARVWGFTKLMVSFGSGGGMQPVRWAH